MCIRTKTSYGCGHSYKTTDECYSSRCKGLERYHYMHEGDCRSCKSGGDAITRGREGKGRYAKEIDRRNSDRDREPLVEVSQNIVPSFDVSGGASPWSPQVSRREQQWQSPTRRKADEAWVKEHDSRMEDLQYRLEKFGSSKNSSPRSERHESPEQDLKISANDDRYYIQNDENEQQRRRDETARKLHQEIKTINEEEYHRTSRRSERQSDRHDSYESFESMPLVRNTTRRYVSKPAKPYAYDSYDQYDSGYGSYSSHRSHGYSTRTDPYVYTATPRGYEVPVPPMTYATNGATYQAPGYGVEIYPRGAPPALRHAPTSSRRW